MFVILLLSIPPSLCEFALLQFPEVTFYDLFVSWLKLLRMIKCQTGRIDSCILSKKISWSQSMVQVEYCK